MRRRTFEKNDVLDRALIVFWRHGYDGCAISDLEKATGLLRQSLYNAFGDKDGLFRAVLARYREHVDAGLAPLRVERVGARALRAYMEAVLGDQRNDRVGACLLVKTALSLPTGDRRIRDEVEAGASAVRAAFADVIRSAVRRGELPHGVDPSTCAAYLYSVLNGLSALAATGGSTRDLEAVLDATFRSLAGKAPKSGRPRRSTSASPRRER